MGQMRLGIASRDTPARRAVGALIAGRDGAFSAADLLADAAHAGIRVGRATVFRTLDLLVDQGAVERLDMPGGEHAYVVCEPERHHHHVVCRGCGRSVEVNDSGLAEVVRAIAEQSGYRIEIHRLELFGLCPECASGDAS